MAALEALFDADLPRVEVEPAPSFCCGGGVWYYVHFTRCSPDDDVLEDPLTVRRSSVEFLALLRTLQLVQAPSLQTPSWLADRAQTSSNHCLGVLEYVTLLSAEARRARAARLTTFLTDAVLQARRSEAAAGPEQRPEWTEALGCFLELKSEHSASPNPLREGGADRWPSVEEATPTGTAPPSSVGTPSVAACEAAFPLPLEMVAGGRKPNLLQAFLRTRTAYCRKGGGYDHLTTGPLAAAVTPHTPDTVGTSS
jgi:hypothetical protein|uniref:Uncharacterized protein n=1 Tax=Haptolina ericina TaxID=156174 RepID=A0A7S3EY29_9EUKA|mmetsp:Transcript_29596/g.67002  ORF Transcript_29596/g.67002 Transcript_29596/m.67002 type:complete len:254 (+) Transcript_29596:20-781(+)